MLTRKGVTIFPEQMKTRSDGELVAQTHKYLRAVVEIIGNFELAFFHHRRIVFKIKLWNAQVMF